MNPADISIPDVLHQAAGIFLQELQGHTVVFESAEKELQPLVSNAKSFLTHAGSCAKTLAERCHLVKGGAGFLNLTELREAAGNGEKFFRALDGSTDVQAVLQEIAKFAEVLREHSTALEGALHRKPDRDE